MDRIFAQAVEMYDLWGATEHNQGSTMGNHSYPEIRTTDKLALRVNEACIAIGISRSTFYKLVDAGKLRTTKVGGRRVVLRENLEALLHADADASNEGAR